MHVASRTTALVFAATLLFAGIAPAAGATPVTGTGTVTCTDVSGTISFHPPYRFNGATAQKETVRVHLAIASCSGTGDGAHVLTAAATGKMVITPSGGGAANDCTQIGGQPGTFTVTVAWRTLHGTHHLMKTTLTLGTTGTLDGNGHVTFVQTGSTSAGSFAGDGAGTDWHSNESLAQMNEQCSTRYGLAALPVTTGTLHLA